MAELAVQPAHGEAFARSVRKVIERSIGRHEADGAAFWRAIAKMYQHEPGRSRALVKRSYIADKVELGRLQHRPLTTPGTLSVVARRGQQIETMPRTAPLGRLGSTRHPWDRVRSSLPTKRAYALHRQAGIARTNSTRVLKICSGDPSADQNHGSD
ncbi:hypothetical protein [Methylobacterium durans]|uniref:hypothetical protein n=1 Tax=Methylobacterium durans TaxID=2202825 RepID=UPI0013A59181|nr:hypothetical protein [Methylobacterium durans]